MEAWVKEIYLRACIRIGELSRELDKAKPGTVAGKTPGGSELPAGGKFKAEALADAGISTSTAHEYEQLAGGREEQAHAAVKAGADAYLADARAEGEVPTLAGLKAAVREAVVATLGPPPARPRSIASAYSPVRLRSVIVRARAVQVSGDATACCPLDAASALPRTLALVLCAGHTSSWRWTCGGTKREGGR
jgi:hypothetical protein